MVGVCGAVTTALFVAIPFQAGATPPAGAASRAKPGVSLAPSRAAAADAAAAVDAGGTRVPPQALPDGPQNPFDYEKQTLQISGPLPNLKTLTMAKLGALLYSHLLADVPPDRTGAILEAAMVRLGKNCGDLNAFQIYRYRTGARTLKIKCPGKPLFALSVNLQGSIQVSGGDGSIGELSSVDGRIYSLFGKSIDVPRAPQVAPAAIDLSRPRPPAAGAAAAPLPGPRAEQPRPKPPAVEPVAAVVAAKPASGQASPPVGTEVAGSGPDAATGAKHRWLWIANGLGLAVIALGGFVLWRSRRRAAGPDDWGLSSDDKDVLIEESREVYPDIYQHPQGFFISRGGRGRRRIFKSTLGAMLYRDYGLKVGEIRV